MASHHEPHVDSSTAKTGGVEESQSELPICDWTEKAEIKLRRKYVNLTLTSDADTNTSNQN